MAVKVRNILVGAGRLWTADVDTQLPAFASGDGNSFNDELDTDGNWTEVGATQEGVEVGYEPDYGEVEVDQLKDAAVLFNQGLNVTMTTNIAEATLDNLLLAWGLPDSAYDTGQEKFSIGVPESEPVERSVSVVGQAPPSAGSAQNERERIYLGRRVVSMEGSTHSLRRTEATVFPVTFRMLPLPESLPSGDTSYEGEEYGFIVDRVL